jgi:glycosyltransferase involved in cell wall biosynthesis
VNRRIRILHFARIINGGDFIDSIVQELDVGRFDVSALIGVQPSRPVGGRRYIGRILNITPTTRNYPSLRRALKRAVVEYRPDIVHSHHYDESLIAASLTFGHHFKLVVGHHYSDHIYKLSSGGRRVVILEGERMTNARASCIVVPSSGVEPMVHAFKKDRRKVLTIPYGLSLPEPDQGRAKRASELRHSLQFEDRCVIVACSRLSREKGQDVLIRAFAKVAQLHPAAALVVVGSGPESPVLQRLVEDLNLDDKVTFVGWRDDAYDWMALADILVHPAYSESFCQVLLEAMALGKPVIMTPVGAAPEAIGDNERGVLVPAGDVDALSTAVGHLVTDEQARLRLGALARSFAVTYVQPARIARIYEQLYESIVDGS